eukprot:CAMPEP_0198209442 /NCGR_PEP_ID=MMETSP1445-20131203/15851_1 /TAXON_ID=36898 /ORGANISM="Pyramimonas sp., Strain CCMP2087" /LENGTH=36 /DNA_ID= /DNA_START= /DNA_END= /DNA_ORIENTATION=
MFETMHDNRVVNARAEALKRKALQVREEMLADRAKA